MSWHVSHQAGRVPVSTGQLLDFVKRAKERRLFHVIRSKMRGREPRPRIYALHRCRGAICVQCREFHVRVVDLSRPETYRSIEIRLAQQAPAQRLVGNA